MKPNFVRTIKIFFSLIIACSIVSDSLMPAAINAQSKDSLVQKYKMNKYALPNEKSTDKAREDAPEDGIVDNQSLTIQKNHNGIKQPIPVVSEPVSAIEAMFNNMFTIRLQQYGYNYFKKISAETFLPVGDRYVVGPGDTIAVYFWGDPVDILGLKGFYSLIVDRDGKIFLKNVGVFYVWGLDISKIREIIYNALHKKFRRFQIEVTLGKLRQYPVYVSGYVNQPGIVMATGVNTIFDILCLAGGIAKNGSVRNIILKKKEKAAVKTIRIDLYALLINGKPFNLPIREGDSILVRPIGRTVGIDGVVKRPAIYELSDETKTIQDIIDLAGGVLPSVYSPGISLYRYTNNNLTITEGNSNNKSFLQTKTEDGDFILIKNVYSFVENEITVKGYIGYPGKYSFQEGIQLSDVLKKVGILPDTNLFSANIRRDKDKTVIPFSPKEVIDKKIDFALHKRDVINFYPCWLFKPIMITGEISNAMIIPYHNTITLLDVLKQVHFKKSVQHLKAEIYPDELSTETINNRKSSPVIYLRDLLVKATKESNITLPPGSRVLIRSVDDSEKGKSVTVLGQVNHPGVYRFKSGTKLYDILKQAGGYTNEAYPRGLIFIRRSAMRLQEEQIQISLLSMRESLAKQQEAFSGLGGGASEDRALIQMVLRQYEQMLGILKEKSQMTLGRIALEIPKDLDTLKDHLDNIRLVENDYIFIPQKPSYILVLGDVYNQMSLPYDSGKTVNYYLSQLGGMAKNADEDNMYIIKTNGKIMSVQQFSSIFKLFFMFDWDRNKLRFARSFDNMVLEEGDTIVVPTELRVPIMWRSLLKDIAQIMFQSISTAVLATRL